MTPVHEDGRTLVYRGMTDYETSFAAFFASFSYSVIQLVVKYMVMTQWVFRFFLSSTFTSGFRRAQRAPGNKTQALRVTSTHSGNVGIT